jgi:hypothetical protein
LAGGVVVLAASGTAALVDKAKKSFAPTSSEAIVQKARHAVSEAKTMVRIAEGDLQQEKRKWFNSTAIDAARLCLLSRQRLLEAHVAKSSWPDSGGHRNRRHAGQNGMRRMLEAMSVTASTPIALCTATLQESSA